MAAFDSKYLRITKQAGTGSQTVTGVGFRGKALLLWSSHQTSAATDTSALFSVGMTDGVLQSVRFIRHPGSEASTTSAQAEQTDRIAWQSSATSGGVPTIQVQGQFLGFTDDGFVINWITNDGAATIYHALVLGGHRLDAKFTQVKITVNSGGTMAVTGVGFQPEAFIVMGGAADEFGTGDYNFGAPFGSIHGFGFSNALDNVCGWTLGRGTAGAADANRGQHTNRVSSVRTANLTGAAELMGMRITAANADGYTLTRDAGTTTHQPVQHVLCLRGCKFALGSLSTPAGTGSQTLELPFEPAALMLQTLGQSASDNADHMGLAMGLWHEDGSGGSWIGGVDAANPSVYRRSHYTDKILQSHDASTGTADLAVSVTSVSSAGAVLNWTTVPASANAVLYMAIGPSLLPSSRNLLTGYKHTMIGSDSVIHGVEGTLIGDRSVLLNLDGVSRVVEEDGALIVYGDIIHNGSALSSSSSLLTLLTADPASPTDDTCWVVREGTSPTQTVSLKARISGTTVTIAAITR
jgi:hypothetical protein